jgi:hypothetical protein
VEEVAEDEAVEAAGDPEVAAEDLEDEAAEEAEVAVDEEATRSHTTRKYMLTS